MAGKAERTREFILEASYTLFAKKGFKEVTMKDVCEVTNLSRGGLYSHFSGTDQIFEALLGKITEKDAMDFHNEIERGVPAATILENALLQMEEEMQHPEDSLSVAIYEYAHIVDHNMPEQLNHRAKERWSELIRYGIRTGEFHEVDLPGIVNVILFSYQGIRMWSRIIPMQTETFQSMVNYIKDQLIKGGTK
jgi:AcrR family transcriptional regulator